MASHQSGGSQQSGGSHQSGSSEREGSGSEAGKKGGQHSGSHQPHDDTKKSERGGAGSFANDPEKASEAGRKGGQHSHSDSRK